MSLKTIDFLSKTVSKVEQSYPDLGCNALSLLECVADDFHFVEIEVGFVFKALALLKVDCHVVHLSISFVGKVGSLQH